MAGMIIPVFSRRLFSQLTPTTNAVVVPIVKVIDISQWRDAALYVRVHGTITYSGTASIGITLLETLPSEEDPAVDFTITATPVASITLNYATLPTRLFRSNVSGAASIASLQCNATITVPAASTIAYEISAELVVKD